MMRVVICNTCAKMGASPQGEGFARSLSQAVEDVADVDVVTTACMNLCSRPMALLLQGAGRESYVFAEVEAGDLDDAAALVRLYAQAEGGEISDARPAGRLRDCLVAKLPAV